MFSAGNVSANATTINETELASIRNMHERISI